MAPSLQPRMKAAQIKNSLAVAERMAGDRAAALREAIGPEVWETIEGAVRTDWLPLSVDIALSRAVEDVCGPGRDRERSRTSTGENLNARLLAPFVEGVRKVFGLSPKPALKVSPRAWKTVYKDCGDSRFVDVSEREAALDFENMPREVLESPLYLSAIAGGLHAVLDMCGVEGHVEPRDADVAAGTVRFLVTWT
jgi:hypothetical protein